MCLTKLRPTIIALLALVAVVVALQSFPRAYASPSDGKMYWTDFGTAKIQRANLDGSSVEDLVITGLISPFGIAVDAAGAKMWPPPR